VKQENHSQIHSCNQPVPSNEGNGSVFVLYLYCVVLSMVFHMIYNFPSYFYLLTIISWISDTYCVLVNRHTHSLNKWRADLTSCVTAFRTRYSLKSIIQPLWTFIKRGTCMLIYTLRRVCLLTL